MHQGPGGLLRQPYNQHSRAGGTGVGTDAKAGQASEQMQRSWRLAMALLSMLALQRIRTTAVAHSIAEAAGPWYRATSLTAAVSSSREGDWQYISSLLQLMRRAQVQRNEFIFSSATSALSKAARWGEALLLAPTNVGIEANLIFRGASLPRGAWPQVLVHVAALSQEGFAPNAVILGSGIDICAKQREWLRAGILLADLRGSGFRCDTVAVNAALGPHWSGAIALTNDALDRGLDANVATYGAIIGACEIPGRWETSLQLLQKAARAAAADAISFQAAIAACASAGRRHEPSCDQSVNLFSCQTRQHNSFG
eukprot:s607_g8.t1